MGRSVLMRGASFAAVFIAVVAPLVSAQMQWVRRSLGTRPPAQSYHAMAWDGARQQVVLLGAATVPKQMDTWTWNGVTWRQQGSVTGPPVGWYAMAYDAARRKVVAFGSTGYYQASETWEWDGRSWTKRTPPVSPPVLAYHAMAYDAARQRVVLFGGGVVQSAVNDTWEWDGSVWIRQSPAASPPARLEHAMAYDAARQRVTMFGGRNAALLNDTWWWQGSTWIRETTTSAPPARSNHAMAYDARVGRVVLFGGRDGTGPGARLLDDTWLWDGSAWMRDAPALDPPGRAYHAMAFDGSRQRMVLFGGQTGSWPNYYLDDHWEYGATHLVGSGTPHPGGVRNLAVWAGLDPGLPYQVGTALGTGPIRIGGLLLDLAPDPLLVASVSGIWPAIFQGYRGVIGANGLAAATLRIPGASVLVGYTIHSAFVTFRTTGPPGIRSVSNTDSFLIRP
jgi:hypothetical protein